MAALILTVPVGWGVTEIVGRRADTHLRNSLAVQAEMVAGGVDIERFRQLRGDVGDVDSTQYTDIHRQFSKIRASAPECRFISCLVLRVNNGNFPYGFRTHGLQGLLPSRLGLSGRSSINKSDFSG